MRVAVYRLKPGYYGIYVGEPHESVCRGYLQKFQTKWIGWDKEAGAFRGPFGLSGSPFNTLNQAKAFAREYYGGSN